MNRDSRNHRSISAALTQCKPETIAEGKDLLFLTEDGMGRRCNEAGIEKWNHPFLE
ncbi:MAG TPA: hypothetical protein PLE24_05540 [Chitinispirillaceae bacterium]|jgi:hypothetical protein|nr:hypothetical protein [Chitinispirillaceae bacterium]